jgi:hypothetical protein
MTARSFAREFFAPVRTLRDAFNGMADALPQMLHAIASCQALFWALVSLNVGVCATLITNAITGG